MKLSCIIPAYNRHPLTVRHVEECMKSSVLPDEIVVVNDGGPPELREMLIALPRNVPIVYARIEEDILWNYNGAVNLGIWLSRGDVIALEDTDHIPDRNTYEIGLKALEENPDVDRISYGRKIVQASDVHKPMEEWLCTGTMGTNVMVSLLRRCVFLKSKGQSERLCGRYGWMGYSWVNTIQKMGVKSLKQNYYWAVLGDQGEPGLQRGLHPVNRKFYKELARSPNYHLADGILNFSYTFERF